MLLIVITRSAEVGTLLIVRNCWPKELVLRHDSEPVEELQEGFGAKRLLKVV